MAAHVEELDAAGEDQEDDENAYCNAIECLDPPNYKASMKTPQAEHWKTAIEGELKCLLDNRTWIVVVKPAEVKPLSSRFVFN